MNKYQNALEILRKLNNKNFEAYIVGGYPRDLYLQKQTSDIDICTNAKYEDLKKIFGEINNNQYGSYKIMYKNNEYEITTYRKEINYQNNRFPKIKHINTLKKDIKRRDFIINTLCIDKYGNYIDLMNAKQDIDNKIIKLVGNKKSFKHDSLRILRAIRFATILNFKLDAKLEKAIIKYKHLLINISYDRKKQELNKIFKNKNIHYGIELIKKFELEKYLSINLNDLKITSNLNAIWSQIIIDESYNFTRQEQKEIKIFQKLTQKKFNKYDLYIYGPKILEIVNEIKNGKKDINKLYEQLPIKDRDDIDISFEDISKIKNIKYNKVNEIITDIEKQIINEKIKNKKSNIKKYIEKKYKHTF